eukprot:TRINITY_DN7221_c0_g1_i1.p1 TRINITY_DN7221_c0_g1~~TRINITY_DN7221_c0_g1_i1.p1  ORF type:complete len:744 (+),score=199.23 TRINITY_DN7221_c0_g1_i1:66-2297(+)
MVGFGRFLEQVGEEHGLDGHLVDYYDLKLLLEDIVQAHAARNEESPDDAKLLAGLEHSPPDLEAAAMLTPTLPTPPATNARCPEAFIARLEEELDRVNDLIKKKLRSLRRVRRVLDSARAVRGSSTRAQEFAIVMVQLSNLYDDIMLVLWFMYLNSIAVSKIVKKYNKNVPAEYKYTVDPTKWQFLRTWLVSVQKAKAVTENEYVACLASAPEELAKSVKVERKLKEKNKLVIKLAEGMKELIKEHRHHIFLHGDPTEWAVAPTLAPASRTEGGREPRRRWNRDIDRLDCGLLSAQYVVGPIIGSGAYGEVRKARKRSSAQSVAVKTIYDPWSHQILGQRTYREIHIMQQLRHPNIIPLLDLIVDAKSKDLHIIMPIIAYTCEELLNRGQLLSQHKKWFMFQLLSAVAYCHALGVVHRDLKLSNILIDNTPRLFLSDFGLARTLSSGDATACHDNPDYVQTQWYRAPEVLLCSKRTSRMSDIWSLGCIFAELLTGVPLFPGQDAQQQLELIVGCCPVPVDSKLGEEIAHEIKRPLVPDRTLEDALETTWRSGTGQEDFEFPAALALMKKLLQFEPESRCSAVALLEDEWFKDIPVHESLIEAVKESASPVSGEEPVRLRLPCTVLHSSCAYRDALVTSTHAIAYKKKMRDVAIARHQAAQLIQRWWKWRKHGGRRPVLPSVRSRALGHLSVCGSITSLPTPPSLRRNQPSNRTDPAEVLGCECSLLPGCSGLSKTVANACLVQ